MKTLQGTALLHSGSKALFFVELFGDSKRSVSNLTDKSPGSSCAVMNIFCNQQKNPEHKRKTAL